MQEMRSKYVVSDLAEFETSSRVIEPFVESCSDMILCTRILSSTAKLTVDSVSTEFIW